MTKRQLRPLWIYGIIMILGLAVLRVWAASAETLSLAQLRRQTHIHGIAVDRQDPSRLYLATHHGLFLVSQDGQAKLISANKDDLMGFTPHPIDPEVLYASGHPAEGGNLGFIMSTDGGRTWRQLAKGVNGPVDFHQMDVSKADPKVIYGAYGDLQVSRDGGHNWERVAPLPNQLIDLAASAKEVDRLYAATRDGLFYSSDGGRSWQPAHLIRRPATLVETSSNGDVYAFVIGLGLIKSSEPSLLWTTLSEDFGDRYPLHLAIDPTNPDRLYAATHAGEILASRDGGRTWGEFAGH